MVAVISSPCRARNIPMQNEVSMGIKVIFTSYFNLWISAWGGKKYNTDRKIKTGILPGHSLGNPNVNEHD